MGAPVFSNGIGKTEAEFEAALILLEQPSRPVSLEEATRIANDMFGMTGVVSRLPGERDRNFRFRCAEGGDYVLKIAHCAEQAAVLDLQDSVLGYLRAKDPALAVPKLMAPSVPNALWRDSAGEERVVRMVTFLPGTPLGNRIATVPLCNSIGQMLGRLDQALVDFHHPAQSHALLWNLRNAAYMGNFIRYFPTGQQQALARAALKAFEQQVQPVGETLPLQVIHNDFNVHNILCGEHTIEGVIDFGDVIRAPRVQDLAIAASYMMGSGTQPLEQCMSILSGYCQTISLTRAELKCLPAMMGARLVMSLGISSWRASRNPADAEYITRNQEIAWRALARLEELQDILRDRILTFSVA
ncbi:phosphotransferase [Gluconobacter kanchanaburiensis]|uniref:Hydroxylysine kinase n=1 Tax=Gluconobacter kanchanaburiensis NBRC 103587 TaxID=1307948 RepID=A0A511BC33_9PROT|nr:phosphotransferase [Gluconobacter kanchanaburiensis]MBF0862985.1 phosphotransferase [Gluconobacter kanchanaburiensis]GBR70394.1 aminotransferase [Gluconobacter kanchanaburiensis NBRC 103587]GEK97391.1 homoserine kinase [Gluconobacter kanchanaburiensis NBRC 103587]